MYMYIKILSALYGQGNTWADVKNILDMKIVDNHINIIVNNDLFGDPSPYNMKQLKVKYNLSGDIQKRIINEHKRFITDIFNVGSLEDILKVISENKNGVEIGGPSFPRGTKILYQNANNFDNVVWSNDTVWYKQQDKYNFSTGKSGKIIINDATNISSVKDKTYDFIFSSHCLEHIANPLKAVKEWIRIVKDNGFIIIIVPEKSRCFDHKRKYSKFNTLLSQYEKNVNEDDLSTLNEILKFHDLPMDIGAPQHPDKFKKRCLNNFYNRCLHHYVYDDNLLLEICNYFKCEHIYKITQGINRWFIMKKV